MAIVSWTTTNAYLYFYFEDLESQILSQGGFEHAPRALLDDWVSDGAPRTFTLMLGWAYGLLYLALCCVVYALLVRKFPQEPNVRNAA